MENDPRSQRLGKYDILEEIGRGGFAVVYKALDTSPLRRTVALKVLAPHLAQDPAFVARFIREARVAAGLRHPNIVVIHEIDEDQGQHYIAMEYLEGQTLDRIIEQHGALPLEWVIDIASQIGSALDYAHSKNIIHRDVKPGNIVVNDQGHVTLMDFGLVKAAEASRLTVTGSALGTPEYMSPEQAELEASEPLDHRSDVYSFAIVLFQMCTGEVPFTGSTPSAILYKHVHEPPPTPSAINPALPPEIEDVLLQSLAKKPDERHETARELASALQEAVESQASPRFPRLQASWSQTKTDFGVRIEETAGKLSRLQKWGQSIEDATRSGWHEVVQKSQGWLRDRPAKMPQKPPSRWVPPPAPKKSAAQERIELAAIIEVLLGLAGFLGVGWLLAHRTGVGIALLIGWWMVILVMVTLTALTLGLSLCIWLPIHVAVPIVSAVFLYRTSREENSHE